MALLVTDCDDTLVHVGGTPDGKPREHIIDAIKVLMKGGWDVKVWSMRGEQHAVDTVKLVGLDVKKSQCFAKPPHPYTKQAVTETLGAMPDLQFDDMTEEQVPGVLFVHTMRTGDTADQADANTR